MRIQLSAFVAAFFLTTAAVAQVGTQDEQAARRECWTSVVGGINRTPADDQILPLNECIKKILGRQDPYMTKMVARVKANLSGNLGEERTDFGVPAQSTPYTSGLGEATPTHVPGARTITTAQMEKIVDSGSATIFDVWDGSPGSFPSSKHESFFGVQARDADGEKQLKDQFLAKYGDFKRSSIVFLCAGVRCRESYNAALRARQAGFTNVMWYRGGYASWKAAGR